MSRIKKMSYFYTMEYYSTVKNKDTRNLELEWVEWVEKNSF